MTALRQLDYTVGSWQEPPADEDPWMHVPEPELSLRLTFAAIFLIATVCLVGAFIIPTGWV